MIGKNLTKFWNVTLISLQSFLPSMYKTHPDKGNWHKFSQTDTTGREEKIVSTPQKNYPVLEN